MARKNIVSKVAMLLVVVGALNWGLVGAFQYNLVNEVVGLVFNGRTAVNVARLVYTLVGIAGLYQIAEAIDGSKK